MKIGVSLRVVNAPNYDEKRDALSHDWISLLEEIELVPILIPNKLKNVNHFLETLEIKGLILSGGDNIGDNQERDETERELIKFSIKEKIPLFGVCRGMQAINKFFGGKIRESDNKKHVGKPHTIKITNPNFIIDNDLQNVNSFHNNIIVEEELGVKLKKFAVTNGDNTIEGFFHEELPIVGVMWHPEREPNKFNKLILNNFIKQKIR